jgi:hypothetical protein
VEKPAAVAGSTDGTSLAARLTVRRPGPGNLSDNYPITVSLDGAKLASLMPGRSVTLDMAAGSHRLRAFNTLMWKTVAFEVAHGDHVAFVVSNRAGPGSTIGAIIGTGWFYPTVDREG